MSPETYPHKLIEAFAEAWASIDGRAKQLRAERDGEVTDGHPDWTGHYDGYMEEAGELLKRAHRRCAFTISVDQP